MKVGSFSYDFAFSITCIDYLPLIWIKYKIAITLSKMASVIAPTPKFLYYPSSKNCEAKIVEILLYLSSNNSSKSACCWVIVEFNNHSSMINKSTFANALNFFIGIFISCLI